MGKYEELAKKSSKKWVARKNVNLVNQLYHKTAF